jgi:hypothetical protein
MSSTKKVHNTHIGDRLRELHGAMIDIASVMNRPQRDEAMVRAAGISLDRALFPLLVSIERRGPIASGAITPPSAARSPSWKASVSSSAGETPPIAAFAKPPSRHAARR